jgi:hypothetical protein
MCLPRFHRYTYQYGPCVPAAPGEHRRQYGLPQFTPSRTYEPLASCATATVSGGVSLLLCSGIASRSECGT